MRVEAQEEVAGNWRKERKGEERKQESKGESMEAGGYMR